MFLGLLGAAAGCNLFLPSQLQSNRAEITPPVISAAEQSKFQKEWLGKSTSDVKQKFGPPTRLETGDDGASRYYYTEPSQTHYIFEFNVKNKVANAAILN